MHLLGDIIPGDTTFEVFLNPPNPDLLRVKLLITETTYIDDCVDQNGVTSKTRARDRGHIHIQVRFMNLNVSFVTKQLKNIQSYPIKKAVVLACQSCVHGTCYACNLIPKR